MQKTYFSNRLLIVRLSTRATSINIEDKLRIIRHLTYISTLSNIFLVFNSIIINGTEFVDDNNIFYEWSTSNNLLSISQIKMYQTNQHNIKYLILASHMLKTG
eukprot:107704_1